MNDPKPFIRSASPSISEQDIELVNEALRFGWQDKMNYHSDMFVAEFSEVVGTKYCLPTAHCTDAIHLALLSLDIGSGDEVIVPDLTWVASAAPITYTGAVPVFADVDPINWCLSAESIERCITSRTKAVVVVDLLGNTPDWDEVRELCDRRGIVIIEDAAEGLGATYNGQSAGTFGLVSLFSFNATKLIMAGQGGALCTNDAEIYKKAKLFSHHGIDKANTGRYYWSTEIGYNYNWTNLQAALALSQLRRIDELISYKRRLFKNYQTGLADIADIALSPTKQNVQSTYWITTAILSEKYDLTKEQVIEFFHTNRIDLRPLFYPISSMPPFKRYNSTDDMSVINPVAYRLSQLGVCLPNGNNLTAQDISRVCATFKDCLNGFVRRFD
jgi:perosamine synthetase